MRCEATRAEEGKGTTKKKKTRMDEGWIGRDLKDMVSTTLLWRMPLGPDPLNGFRAPPGPNMT